jgi:phosphoglycolate phosphatase-like HAD superfamily hydrolase
MKVIFLDFDGVLNTPEEWGLRPMVRALNQQALDNLDELVKRSGAKVVVSSTWRQFYALDALQEFLRARGVKCVGAFISVTPILYESRDKEIASWLNSHEDIKNFVIIDDNGIGSMFNEKLILTDASVGLSADNVKEALDVLEGNKDD